MPVEVVCGLTGVLEAGGEGLTLIPGHEGADPSQALGRPVGMAGDRQVRKNCLAVASLCADLEDLRGDR
jgi:hypothetical protein